jgi:ubiquinone/menaquinone biosynthesis C-methylase UbiE
MKDNFSTQADVYAKYRPNYPSGLFDFIMDHVMNRDSAWDCATGNGQSAKELSRYFKKVYATDISQKQLDNAFKADNIIYSVQSAEQTNFADQSIDLITVSQALHWFRFDDFYKEVNRVIRPGGCLAVWMYSLLRISPSIDAVIETYHFETLKDHWDPERKYVDDNYASVPFPYKEIKTPAFSISYQWTLDDLRGYFTTWSALQKFIKAMGRDPIPELMEKIKPHWKSERMEIVFPITLKLAAKS